MGFSPFEFAYRWKSVEGREREEEEEEEEGRNSSFKFIAMVVPDKN